MAFAATACGDTRPIGEEGDAGTADRHLESDTASDDTGIDTTSVDTSSVDTSSIDTNVDASFCSGIANCLACQCTPVLCIAGDSVEATTCTPRVELFEIDRCACDGKTCDAGLTCVRVRHPPPSGGGVGGQYNQCFELCLSDADCSGGRVCRPNLHGIEVCVDPPACLSDADCNADACGHCVPRVRNFHGGERHLDRSEAECTYEGPCAPGSCAECREDFYRSGPVSGQFHFCAP